MPVTSVHPQYEHAIDLWSKCRTVLQGEDGVKHAGVLYLPQLDGQEERDYHDYRMRAMFYAAADRTVKGLAGAILRKTPTIKKPAAMDDLLEHIGAAGEGLEQMIQAILNEVIGLGRVGLLVDAEENIENGDPFISLYYAENITSWKTETVGGRRTVTRIVLRETVETLRPDDPFVFVMETKYRVLRLGTQDSMENGGLSLADIPREQLFYFVELWRKAEMKKDDKGETWEIERTIVPKMHGGRILNDIPFTIINPSSLDASVEKPPILDLVNVNLSHYRTSADLEHGRHFTALPTAWVAGFDLKTTNLRIGSAVAWVSDNASARAGFLEFTGAGLSSLSEALKDKEHLMAVLGARLLEQQKLAAEAAETVRLRQSGEQSILANIADSTSEGLTRAMHFVAEWVGIVDAQEDVSAELNKDFDVAGIDPQVLTALMAAVQGGLLSWQTFFHNVKRGELIPDNITEEDEAALIAAGVPGGFMSAVTPQPEASRGQPHQNDKSPAQPPTRGNAPVPAVATA